MGKRRSRFCAEPGPPCPGCAGPGRSILARVPAGAGGPRTQARTALCQAPKPLLNSGREAPPPRFPRVPRLPAGQAGALRRRAVSRRGGARGEPKQGRPSRLPLSPRRPQAAASPLRSAPGAARLSPRGAVRGICASRAAPQVVRRSKLHAKHLQGGRPGPRATASA